MIDFHADDYGLSIENSKQIIQCIKEGRLDSISIIPNTTHFKECMELLLQEWEHFPQKPMISVHLDFIDGYSLSEDTLPLLHDETNIMATSWGKLFLASFIPGNRRTQLKQQLCSEIHAQIERVYSMLPSGCTLRIDSHMHTHMIPVVAQALLETIDKYHYPVEFIRIAREPLCPFLKKAALYKTYSPVNFIKNIILNILAPSFERQLDKRNISYGLMWGLIMSGYMDRSRVDALYHSMITYAANKAKDIEILFHPGRMLPQEITACNCKADVNAFYLSDNRDTEKDAVMHCKRN